MLWFTASHRSSLSRELVPVMEARVIWVSSKDLGRFSASQFCSVEFDRRGRWVSLSGPMCQRLCRPAQFGVGLGARETCVKLGGQPWRLVKRT